MRLRDPDFSPRWFKVVMLVLGCVMLVGTPLYMAFVRAPDLFNVDGTSVGLSFLLVLGADRLPEPRGTAAAMVRLVGIILMAAGAILALGSAVGSVL